MTRTTNSTARWYLFAILACLGLMIFSGAADAATDTIGTMASNLTKSFKSLAKLITAGSYIAGLGFSIGAIMKFKAHKDNPTQIQIGTPIALLFIAAALLFLPTLMESAGASIFGEGAQTGTAEGIVDLGGN